MSQLMVMVAKSDGAADVVASDAFLLALGGRVAPAGFSASVQRYRQGRLVMARVAPTTGVASVMDVKASSFSHWFDLFMDVSLQVDEGRVRLATSELVWRTAWWCEGERLGFVTTSLHAAAFLLGDFQPDDDALASLLLRGTLDPVRSHDRRVRQIPRCSELSVELDDGRCSLAVGPMAGDGAHPVIRSDADAKQELEAAIRGVLGRKVADDPSWALALSGGIDSRGILLMLPRRVATVTWGTRDTFSDPESDYSIAARLAQAVGVPHCFIDIQPPDIPVGDVIDTFAWVSEGRSDGINAYIDACGMWRELARSGISCVLRGDQTFADTNRADEAATRRTMGLAGPSDIRPAALAVVVANGRQLWSTERRVDESVPAFRDRVYWTFRVPAAYTALNTVKTQFVDVVNPLVAPEVARVVVSLSDEQRTGKGVYCSLIKDITPPIPFSPSNVFYTVRYADQPHVWRHLQERALAAGRLGLPADVTRYVEEYAGPAESRLVARRSPLRRLARRVLPTSVVRALARCAEPDHISLEPPQLALRVVLADQARWVLSDDASAGRSWRV